MFNYSVAAPVAMMAFLTRSEKDLHASTSVGPTIADYIFKTTVEQLSPKTRIGAGVDMKQAVRDSIHGRMLEVTSKELKEWSEDAQDNAYLPTRFKSKFLRIASECESVSLETTRHQLQSLADDLIDELVEPRFLCIPPDKRDLYDQKSFPFGEMVQSKFPDSERDVQAAARCLALDEWTACVFHLMRALESPLQTLSGRVGVVFSGPTDLENWKNIIDSIESNINERVRKGEQQKKGHERNDTLRVYGEVNLNFRHFKNAWRNNVAHAREHYDEREATKVYESVRSFMQTMAVVVDLPLPAF